MRVQLNYDKYLQCADEISHWLREDPNGACNYFQSSLNPMKGRLTFIFEREQDYLYFLLKWG